MAKYFDPHAPATRVVFGGVVFVDNVSEDITAGPATLELFASAGIIEITAGDLPKSTVEELEDLAAPVKPAKPTTKPAK